MAGGQTITHEPIIDQQTTTLCAVIRRYPVGSSSGLLLLPIAAARCNPTTAPTTASAFLNTTCSQYTKVLAEPLQTQHRINEDSGTVPCLVESHLQMPT